MTDQRADRQNNDRRVGVLLMLGLTVLFGGLYVAAYYFTSDKVPTGTTVAGVEIGGQRPAVAERKVAQALSEDAGRAVRVAVDGERATINPQEAGLSVDIEQSVSQAGGGRSWHPGRIWNYFAGGDSYEPVVEVDRSRLTAAIEEVVTKLDRPARDGAVRITDGEVEPRMPRDGRMVDREAAADVIVESFPGDQVVELPVESVEPEIDEGEVREAMSDFANPATSGPVTISFDGEDAVLSPQTFSSAISLTNRDGELEPVLDKKALMRALRPTLRTAATPPRQATVKLVNGRPKVLSGRVGKSFKRKDITEEFLSLVVAEGGDRTLEVSSVAKRPQFTTADARKLRIKRVVSSFTTYYPHADYRNTNLGRAAELVNGTVLKPGDTFSLNDTVGERTAANGFTEGFIISNGIFKEDFGGGVSQVATTLFNAAFFAGLEDVEHKPHSFYIDRYPVGREATVAWGAIDLRFKNDTPYGILIEADVDPSSPASQGAMNVRMWSTKHWDIEAGASERYNFTQPATRTIYDENCEPNTGYGGFDIDVFRYFRKPGSDKVVRKETMHTTYTPSDTVICR